MQNKLSDNGFCKLTIKLSRFNMLYQKHQYIQIKLSCFMRQPFKKNHAEREMGWILLLSQQFFFLFATLYVIFLRQVNGITAQVLFFLILQIYFNETLQHYEVGIVHLLRRLIYNYVIYIILEIVQKTVEPTHCLLIVLYYIRLCEWFSLSQKNRPNKDGLTCIENIDY